MRYQRSLEIEHRLETTLRLIRVGKYSTPMLAERLGTSIPTVSRYINALRERGHDIRAERKGGAWRFVLIRQSPPMQTPGLSRQIVTSHVEGA